MNDPKPCCVGAEALLTQLLDVARNSALAEMASAIAHEINQPLGAIATFSQAGDRLLNRADPMVGRALDVFREINSEALAAGEGIRRIRRLFDQGNPERHLRPMAQVIEELRPVLETMAQSARIPLVVAVEGSTPNVLIDKLRIQHVIFVLVQNALDACAQSRPPPPIELSAHVERHAVEVSVVDSGCGVDEEDRQHLFRPFYTTKSNGTGLGLASSRAIVEAHEGTIGFEGLLAGGCRFWFRLPIVPN